MMNYRDIEKALTEGATTGKVITKLFKDQTAYDTVMSNCQRIGGKDSVVFRLIFWKSTKIIREYTASTWKKYIL